MKYLSLLVVLFICLSQAAGQKPVSQKEDSLVNLNVNLKELKAFLQLKVDKGIITMDKLPDSMIICFPPSKIDAYSLQFNEEPKKSFKLIFDEGVDNDSVVFVQYNLLENGTLKLIFKNNQLVQIVGRNTLVNRDIIPGKNKKPYVKIIVPEKAAKADKHKSAFDTLNTTVAQVQDLNITAYVDTARFYSYSADPTAALYLKPVDKNDRIIINRIDNKDTVVIYKYTHINGQLKVVTKLRPKAEHILDVVIKGPSDSSYFVKSEFTDYFLDQESSVGKSLNPTGSASSSTATNAPSTGPATQDVAVPAKSADQKNTAAARAITTNAKDSSSKTNLYFEELKTNPLTKAFALNIDTSLFGKITDTSKTKELLSDYFQKMGGIVDFLKTEEEKLPKKLPKNQKRGETIMIPKDNSFLIELQKDKSLLVASTLQQNDIQKLETDYLSLEMALEKFNSNFRYIDDRVDQYLMHWSEFKLNMERQLNISQTQDTAVLAAELIAKLLPLNCPQYYSQFKDKIKQIVANYYIAENKKPGFRTSTFSVPVRNQDEQTIYIVSKSNTTNLDSLTFSVSRGLKIDFSTGVFINGINNVDYVLGSHHFRYRNAQYFTNVLGKDSIVYLPGNRDTTGNLINRNKKTFNYSTGFLIHVYTRTGNHVNYGGAVGVSLNSSNLMMMLGFSTMFNMNHTRLALAGGLAVGKQKAINADSRQYQWSKKEPDGTLYGSAYDVPKFFPGSSVTTYDKLQFSWFFGITYNFATVNTGSSGK